jgi:hypothetical protein
MEHSVCLVAEVAPATTECSSRHSVNRNVTQVSHGPAHPGYGRRKTNKDYYSCVRIMSSSTSHRATGCKIPGTSKSLPDGLSLVKTG